jgi:hypothetical protein
MSIIDLVDSVGRDVRYALRALPRRPAFTLAAVLTLALGIGATTAIFSVVYSVLIKPLPYPSPDELVRIRHPAPGVNSADLSASSNMLLTYRQENRTLTAVGLWLEDSATLTDRGEAERVRALRVSDGTLQALGIHPLRGRWFTDDEYQPAADGPSPVIGNADSAATKRRSGVSFRWIRRAGPARWRCRRLRKSSASCRPVSGSSIRRRSPTSSFRCASTLRGKRTAFTRGKCSRG